MKTCTIKDCFKKHYGNGFCSMHNARFRRNGDPMKTVKNPHGAGGMSLDGYFRITVNNVRIKAHRHIMEQHIGRKLLPKEVVHHINGNKLDNRIENLEIINQSIHRHKHAKSKTIGDMRNCLKCGLIKHKSLFYRDKYSISGLKTWCKSCHYQDKVLHLKN